MCMNVIYVYIFTHAHACTYAILCVFIYSLETMQIDPTSLMSEKLDLEFQDYINCIRFSYTVYTHAFVCVQTCTYI